MGTSTSTRPKDAAPLAPRPLAPAATISFAGRTDRGRCRSRNEDALALLPDLGLFIVADGIGGAAAGEIASRMFVHGMERAFSPGDRAPASGVAGLVAAVHAVNGQIFEAARRARSIRGMGTTFAALLDLGDSAVIAHVGDSRVYRLRDGHLGKLTEDHTLANELVRAGALAESDVASHPKRHVLTRAVGRRSAVEVSTRVETLLPGDVYLLCSDGLHDELTDRDIAAVLGEHADVEDAAQRLIAQANESGGSDNITAVVVRWAGR